MEDRQAETKEKQTCVRSGATREQAGGLARNDGMTSAIMAIAVDAPQPTHSALCRDE